MKKNFLISLNRLAAIGITLFALQFNINAQSTIFINGSQATGGNISPGALNTPVYTFQIYAPVTSVLTLTSFTFQTAGTYVLSDIASSSLKIWSSQNYLFAPTSSTLLTTIPLSASGTNMTVSGLNATFDGYNLNSQYTYFYITADAALAPTLLNTLSISSLKGYTLLGINQNNGTPLGSGTALRFNTPTFSVANRAISVTGISQGSLGNDLAHFGINIATSGAVLSSLTVSTTGTYLASDITNFSLYYFNGVTGTYTFLANNPSVPSGGVIKFVLTPTGIATIPIAANSSFFVKADVSTAAGIGGTISLGSTNASDVILFTGTSTGTGGIWNSRTIGNPLITVTSVATPPTFQQIGTNNVVIGGLAVSVAGASAQLSQLSVRTSGTYTTTDIDPFGFKVWYSASTPFNIFSSTQLAQVSSSIGGGENLLFNLNTNFAGGTGYLFVTVDISNNGADLHTISMNALSFPGSMTFASGTVTGFTSNAGVQTIKLSDVNIQSMSMPGSSFGVGTDLNPVFKFQPVTTTYNSQLNDLIFTLTGTFLASDIVSVTLRRNFTGIDNDPSTFTAAGPFYSIPGSGGVLTLPGVNQGLFTFFSPYYYIAINLSSTAGVGRTIQFLSNGLSSYNIPYTKVTGSSNNGSVYTFGSPSVNVSVNNLGSWPIAPSTFYNDVYSLALDVSGASVTLDQVRLRSFGNYKATDIQGSGLTLWSSLNSTFSQASSHYITGINSSSAGAGENIIFNTTTTSITLPIGRTYLYFTVNPLNTATIGNTIGILSIAGLSFSASTSTITSSIGGLYTITAPVLTAATATPVSPAAVGLGSSNDLIYSFEINDALVTGQLNKVTLSTSGTYMASDLQGFGIRLWSGNSPVFDPLTMTNLGSYNSTSVGFGDLISFNVFQPLSIGKLYFFVTANIVNAAVQGRTMTVLPMNPSTDLKFAVGTATGSGLVVGGLQTIMRTLDIVSQTVAGGNIGLGTTRNLLYQLKVVSNSNANITGIVMSINGTFLTTDFPNFNLLYNLTGDVTDPFTIAGAASLLTTVSGNILTLNGFNIPLLANQDYYLYATASVSPGATLGNNIQATLSSLTNITSNAGSVSGSILPVGPLLTIGSPTVVISSNIIAGAAVTPNTPNVPIYSLRVSISGASARLNGIRISTAGNYTSSDINKFGFYRSDSPVYDPLGVNYLMGTHAGTSTGLGEVMIQATGNSTFNVGTSFIHVVASINGIATIGRTISVNTVVGALDVAFASATLSGIALSGNTSTIVSTIITVASGTIPGIMVSKNTLNNPIYAFSVNVTAGIALNSLPISLGGTYINSDFSNIKLWYSTSPGFNTSNAISLSGFNTVGSPETFTFSGMNQWLSPGTKYFFLGADLQFGAANGRTLSVAGLNLAGIGFSYGTAAGTALAGSVITVATPAVLISSNVTSPATITGGSISNVLDKWVVSVTGAPVAFGNVNFSTNGNYLGADISKFKIWYSTSSVFDLTASIIYTKNGSSGAGEFISYSPNMTLPVGANYFYVTTDLSINAIGGNQISIAFMNSFSFWFNGATTNGNVAASGIQTIIGIQTILGFNPIPNKNYGDVPFAVNAFTNQSLPVSFSLITSPVAGVASISGNMITVLGAGLVTVTASQVGNALNLAAIPLIQTFTINKINPTISFLSSTAVGIGASTLSASTNSTGALSYTITGGTASATVSGTTLSTSGVGSLNIQVNVAADANYNAGFISVVLTVTSKPSPTISFAGIAKTYGNAPFVMTITSTNSTGAITYSIIAGSGAIISPSGVVTITGAGSVTIQASQAGDVTYNPAIATAILTINKATAILVFTSPGNGVFGSVITIGGTSNSTGSVALIETNGTGSAILVANLLTLTGVGVVTITGNQIADANYNATSASQIVTILQSGQTITGFGTIAGQTFGNPPITVSGIATSGLPVTFTVSGPAIISGNSITITGAGTVTVTANQVGNANYNAAASKIQVFNVAKANQTITGFGSIAGQTLGNPPITVSGFATSGLAVSYAVAGPAVIVSNSITFTGAGTVTVTATQVGNANYNPAISVVQLVNVSKINQTITGFGTIAGQVFGNAPFSVSASATSALVVTFTVTGPALIAGNSITITGAGTVTVTATQVGNANYNPANPIVQLFNIAKATPVLLITSSASGALYTLNTITASSISPGPIVYGVLNGTGSAIVAGNTLSLTGAGIVTVTANQVGNANYNAAATAYQIYSIGQLGQTITGFGTIAGQTFGNAPISVSAGATSGLAVSFTVNGPAIISGNSITITGAGTITVTANQIGNVNYTSAASLYRVFNVSKANPTLVYSSSTLVGMGISTLSASTNSTGLLTYSITGGTALASITGNQLNASSLGSINVNILLAADANYNSASINAVLTVNSLPNPFILYANSTKIFRDAPFSMAITSTNSTGLITYSIQSGSGAVIDANTGMVTVTGAGTITFLASQAGDVSYNPGSATATLTINKFTPTLSITSASTGVYGQVIGLTYASLSNASVTYSITNGSGMANVNANNLSLTGVGIVTVTAMQVSNSNYNAAANVNQVFTITIANQTITGFGPIADRLITAPSSFILAGSASSGLTLTYSVTGPAMVIGNSISITGAGLIQITAMQSGDVNFSAAISVSQSFNVLKLTQTLTGFNTISNMVYGSSPFMLNATATSGLSVSYVINGPAAVSGNMLTITSVGVVTVTATQLGDGTYSSSNSLVQLFTVSQATQTISGFGLIADVTLTGNALITLTGASSSGLGLTYSATGPAIVTGNVISLTGPGMVTITAMQIGNANYLAANNVTVSFTVYTVVGTIGTTPGIMLDQTIVGMNQISVYTLSGTANTLTLTASATSSLPVSYSVLGPATISGNVLFISGVGTVTVTANQSGNATYNPASAVVLTFQAVSVNGSSLGISDENENSTIALYPNPTTGKVSINTTQFDAITIYSINGTLVYSSNLESNNTIDLGDLANGVYTVKLTNNKNRIAYKKLVLKR
jgi:hypothetical protein